MQIWVNGFYNIEKVLRIGLTTNVVGPFLSDDSQRIEVVKKLCPNIAIWDNSFELRGDFTSLELLATKHAYKKDVGTVITLTVNELNLGYIHEIKYITENNFVLRILGSEDLTISKYIMLLNMDINHILLSQSEAITSEDIEIYNRFLEIRNQSMRKTRIGFDFTLDHNMNKILFSLTPDFILISIEHYKTML